MTSDSPSPLPSLGAVTLLRALFKPFIEDGKAVPAYAIVPINFQLD